MGFEVENCCCCFSLETGTKIIGGVELLGGILSLISGANDFGKDDFEASITVIQGIIAIIVGILVIIGVFKRNAAYLFPFLFSMAVGIVKYAIELIGHISRALSQEKVNHNDLIGKISTDVLIIGLGIYFLLVVYTLYKRFKSTPSRDGGIA